MHRHPDSRRPQGFSEPVKALSRYREKDFVHDHVLLQQVGKILEGSDDRNAADAADCLGRIHAEAAAHHPACLRISTQGRDQPLCTLVGAHNEGNV